MADAMDCQQFDGDMLRECLQRKSVEELLSVNLDQKAFYTPLGPIVDNVVIKKTPLR